MSYKAIVCRKCGQKANIGAGSVGIRTKEGGPYCSKCWDKYKQQLVNIPCKQCKQYTLVKRLYLKYYENKGGKLCEECENKIHSLSMKKTMSAMSPEQRTKNSKYASSCADKHLGVQRQWDNIRSDPKKYKEICERRKKRSKDNWERMTDETKKKIISGMVNAHGKSRSKISEQLKQDLIKLNIYDGFVSEEVFHGFVPDEINHKIKIIIEFFGDLYHCNPKRYKNPDLYIKAIQRTVQEQWDRDRRRLACFYKHGYSVIIIWEYNYKKNPKKQLDRIKDEIDKKRNT